MMEVTVVPDPTFEIVCPDTFELNVPNTCNLTKALQGFNFDLDLFVGTTFENVTVKGLVPGKKVFKLCSNFITT